GGWRQAGRIDGRRRVVVLAVAYAGEVATHALDDVLGVEDSLCTCEGALVALHAGGLQGADAEDANGQNDHRYQHFDQAGTLLAALFHHPAPHQHAAAPSMLRARPERLTSMRRALLVLPSRGQSEKVTAAAFMP